MGLPAHVAPRISATLTLLEAPMNPRDSTIRELLDFSLYAVYGEGCGINELVLVCVSCAIYMKYVRLDYGINVEDATKYPIIHRNDFIVHE